MQITVDLSQMITAATQEAQRQQQRRDRLRARRDEAIAAGITVAGLHIATDDRSQTRITAAAFSAVLDPEYSVRWKSGGSFTTLDAATILRVATAVRAHVQACFEREAALLDGPDPGEAGDIWDVAETEAPLP